MQQFPTVIAFTTSPLKGSRSIDMKEELIRMQQLKTAYVIPLALPTMGIVPNKLYESLKLLYIS